MSIDSQLQRIRRLLNPILAKYIVGKNSLNGIETTLEIIDKIMLKVTAMKRILENELELEGDGLI